MNLDLRKLLTRRNATRAAIPLLACVLVASVVTGREKPAGPEAIAPQQRVDTRINAARAAEQDLDISLLQRKAGEARADPAADPFARRNFAPAPAQAAAAPQAPAAPAVPELPFRYVGKAIEDGKLAVFVMRGEETFSLSAAQKIDADYRVDKVTESKVTFTYLPLKTKQVLDIQ